eukprot:2035941-Prymnesium_polylepis.1
MLPPCTLAVEAVCRGGALAHPEECGTPGGEADAQEVQPALQVVAQTPPAEAAIDDEDALQRSVELRSSLGNLPRARAAL